MPQFLKIAIAPLADLYTYKLPESLQSKVGIGSVIEVKFRNRTSFGFVLEALDSLEEDLNYKITEIDENALFKKLFTEELISLFKWMADYYVAPLSQVLLTLIPKPLNDVFKKTAELTLTETSEIALKGKTQNNIVNYLKEINTPVDLKELNRKFKGASNSLKSLKEKGIVKIIEEIKNDAHKFTDSAPTWALKDVSLNDAQESATKKINKEILESSYKGFLLHGVTGSGKTEIYIECMKTAISIGGSVILIVPEIALTPQLIGRLRARLGDNIAVLHSAVNKRAKYDAWLSLIKGECKVAIGARSAVFAPVTNLKLIIVDEEHDSSYKQSDGLRYNARDLAAVRAYKNNCPVVFGSATPSLESFANTIKKRYEILELSKKHVSDSEQEIKIVNLNKIKPWEMPSPLISAELFHEIQKSLSKKEQCFVLYNRRGFATYLQCERCKDIKRCDQCDVSLTYHQENNRLLCHYCGISIIPPKKCEACKDHKEQSVEPNLVLKGAGTEKVYDDLIKLFPEAKVARLDRDSADSNTEIRDNIMDSMRNGEIDILVGTQMIAKGHDLPNVTTVGVVDCDVGLNIPDFRAAEKIFQLLTQASGRAGRAGKNSKVILQTRSPKHPSLLCTQNKNYFKFAKLELENRKQHLYPPFSKLLRIVIRAKDPEKAHAVSEAIKLHSSKLIKEHDLKLTVLGPTPAPINKVKNDWRWHLIVKSKELSSIHTLMRSIEVLKKKVKDTHVAMDIDAQDML